MTNKLYSEDFFIPDFLKKKHIPSLDGLRALSILIVIIGHTNFNWQNKFIAGISQGGRLGVQIFFVISGFLITSLLIKEKINNKSINLKSFYIRRCLRILPVAYLFILVVAVLNYLFKLGIVLNSFIHLVTFTGNFDFNSTPWPIKHFWSLCTEEQFYLLFPLLLSINYKWYLNILWLMLALTPVTTFLYYHVITHIGVIDTLVLYSGNFLIDGMYAIVIGSLMAIFLCKYPVNFKINFKIVGFAQLVLIYFICFFFSHNFFVGFNLLICSLLIVVLIFSTIYFTDRGLFKLLNNKIVKKIGVLSYSLYLWQQLFTYSQPWQNLFTSRYAVPINLVCLFCTAYISYTYFEKPFLKLKNKFSTTRSFHQTKHRTAASAVASK